LTDLFDESIDCVRLGRPAMGTRFEVAIPRSGPPRGGAQEKATLTREEANLLACAEAALDEITFYHRSFNLFRRDSFLSFVNASAADRPVRVDPELFALLETCREIFDRSGGAFDITVGPLMECWGFRDGDGAIPDADALGATRASIGFDHVILDKKNSTVSFDRAGVGLDLGGVAKGFALDQAAEILRDECIPAAIIHGGTSTVVAFGAPPESASWKVGIADPAREGALLAAAYLSESALSVSAQHGRCFEADGALKGHLIDPSSGAPAEGALLAAVIAKQAVLADAWSTALVAAGPGRFQELVAGNDAIDAAILFHGPKGAECLDKAGVDEELFESLTDEN